MGAPPERSTRVSAPVSNDVLRCGEGTLTLSASGSSDGNYRWYASQTSTDVLSNDNSYITPSLSASTVYYVSIVEGPCESDRIPVNATIEITPQPVIDFVGSTTICDGESIQLNAPNGFASYLWSTGSTQQNISVSQAGNFTVTVTSANGCESISSVAVSITMTTCTVNVPPVIETIPVTTFIGSSVVLNLLDLISDEDGNLDLSTLRVIGNISQRGAPASIDNQYNLIIDYANLRFTGTDFVTIEVCDDLLACAQQMITIEVIGDLEIFNAMSPNGDGLNDSFIIRFIDLFPETKNNKVTIYNRWGDVVFEIANYDNENRVFSGLNKNGNELPSGTYFYKIEFKSGLSNKTGFISLKR